MGSMVFQRLCNLEEIPQNINLKKSVVIVTKFLAIPSVCITKKIREKFLTSSEDQSELHTSVLLGPVL